MISKATTTEDEKMKRYGNLYERIIDIDNLRQAERKARQGKKNNKGIAIFDTDPEGFLRQLHDDLAEGRFHTSQYSTFIIHEPKERLIYRLPYYPDRIVHHAILNIMEPIWVATFTADSYSCIKGRGIHRCAAKLHRALKDNPEQTTYCLKMDIRKFYPSIDHELMKSALRHKIKDERLLALLDEVVDSAPGIPIGNYLSQYFANIFLTEFDHWLKETKHVAHYFRYADDIVILGGDKRELHGLERDIEAYMKTLHLEIKPTWRVFPTSTGIDFVGFVFYPTHTRLRKGVKQRLCRRIAHILHRKETPERKAFLQELAPWWGWLKHCDSRHLLQTLNLRTPYEIDFR